MHHIPTIVLRVLTTELCYADDDGSKTGALRGIDTDGDGMILQEELDTVRSMSNRLDRNNSIFQNNTSIVSFNEFRYFTLLNCVNSASFEGCSSLREIELPELSTYIGGGVFMYCISLERLVIPEGYQQMIGSNHFLGCTSLKLLDIPSTMKEIGTGVLWNLNNQVVVVCRAITPPSLKNLNAKPLTLYVPDESLSAYQAASGWSQYAKYMKPLSEYAG